MEYGSGVGMAQRLAFERQLLREEKWVVDALKTVKMERHGLEIENVELHDMVKAIEMKGLKRNQLNATLSSKKDPGETSAKKEKQEASKEPVVSSTPQDFSEEFQLPSLDDEMSNDVELNLTVPQHPFFEPMTEEEFEEIDDDYEIEMSMLMNGKLK